MVDHKFLQKARHLATAAPCGHLLLPAVLVEKSYYLALSMDAEKSRDDVAIDWLGKHVGTPWRFVTGRQIPETELWIELGYLRNQINQLFCGLDDHPYWISATQVRWLAAQNPDSYFDIPSPFSAIAAMPLPSGQLAIKDLLIARSHAHLLGHLAPEVPKAIALEVLDYAMKLTLNDKELLAICERIVFKSADEALERALWAQRLGKCAVAQPIFEKAVDAIICSKAPPTQALKEALECYRLDRSLMEIKDGVENFIATLPASPFNLMAELAYDIALRPKVATSELVNLILGVNFIAQYWVIERLTTNPVGGLPKYLEPCANYLKYCSRITSRGTENQIYKTYLNRIALCRNSEFVSSNFKKLTADSVRRAKTATDPLTYSVLDTRHNIPAVAARGFATAQSLEMFEYFLGQMFDGPLSKLYNVGAMMLAEVLQVMQAQWPKNTIERAIEKLAERVEAHFDSVKSIVVNDKIYRIVTVVTACGHTAVLDALTAVLFEQPGHPKAKQCFAMAVVEGIIAGRRVDVLPWLQNFIEFEEIEDAYEPMQKILPNLPLNIVPPSTLFGDLPASAVVELVGSLLDSRIIRASTEVRSDLVLRTVLRLQQTGATAIYASFIERFGPPQQNLHGLYKYEFIKDLGLYADAPFINEFLQELFRMEDGLAVYIYLGLEAEELNTHLAKGAKAAFDAGRPAAAEAIVARLGRANYDVTLARLG